MVKEENGPEGGGMWMNRRSNVLNGFGGRSVNEVSSPSSDGWNGWTALPFVFLSASRRGAVDHRRLSHHRPKFPMVRFNSVT